MKKEWLALLILLGVILGSVLNLRYLKGFITELKEQVDAASAMADAGDWEAAERQAAAAMKHWVTADKYTHILIRHGEIDAVTDDFCALLGAIRSRDSGSIYPVQFSLQIRLSSLYEMERPKPGSIF